MERLTYKEAQKEIKRVGYGKVTGDAGILATVEACVLAHPGLSAQLLYEGAIKTGKTEKELRDMLKRGWEELNEVMWA
jgi:hypothetical protein